MKNFLKKMAVSLHHINLRIFAAEMFRYWKETHRLPYKQRKFTFIKWAIHDSYCNMYDNY